MCAITGQTNRFESRPETSPGEGRESAPCRISITLDGVEWFLYNRTQAYDDLWKLFTQENGQSSAKFPNSKNSEKEKGADEKESYPPTSLIDKAKRNKIEEFNPDAFNWLLEILPVAITARTGSIVLGNRATPMTLIIGFDKAEGTYGALDLPDSLDLFRSVFDFHFTKVRAVFRTNVDFEHDLLIHGKQTKEWLRKNEQSATSKSPADHPQYLRTGHLFRDFLTSIGLVNQLSKKPADTWNGLARFQKDLEDVADDSSRSEYAKRADFLDFPSMDVYYYADEVGPVPSGALQETPNTEIDIGNGGRAPAWGVNVTLHGGKVTYGPWTDRQRAAFVSLFFPPSPFSQSPTKRLEPGELRVHAALDIHVKVAEQIRLHVPTREKSKDWRFRNLTFDEKRKYGWLDAIFASGTTFDYKVPMVCGKSGYVSVFEMKGIFPRIMTSVIGQDDYKLLEAGLLEVSVSMPSPLEWCAPRTWQVNAKIDSQTPEITRIRLLRDHTNLLQDLVADFTSGPMIAPHLFVPTGYNFAFEVKHYALELNLNTYNIASDSLGDQARQSSSTTNTADRLLTFGGENLRAKVEIPVSHYAPTTSEVTFKIEEQGLRLNMTFPDNNTHHSLDREDMHNFANAADVQVSGSYVYFSPLDIQSVERLILDIELNHVVLKAYGHVINTMLNLKDNYFGNFNHCISATEHAHKVDTGEALGDPVAEREGFVQKPFFEVVLGLNSRHNLVLLSQDTYASTDYSVLTFPELTVDLRSHDLFMELTIDVEPISLWGNVAQNAAENFSPASQESSNLTIKAIRAHRAFGPQPLNATYICIWDLDFGEIKAEMTPTTFDGLGHALTTFAHTFSDDANNLPLELRPALDPDVTFLTVRMAPVSLFLQADSSSAFQIQLGQGLALNMHDLPHESWQRSVNLDIEQVGVRSLNLSQQRKTKNTWLESASLKTGIHLTARNKPADWDRRRAMKVNFLQHEDAPTRRLATVLPFLHENAFATPATSSNFYVPPLRFSNILADTDTDSNFSASSSASEFDVSLLGSEDVESSDNDFSDESDGSKLTEVSAAYRLDNAYSACLAQCTSKRGKAPIWAAHRSRKVESAQAAEQDQGEMLPDSSDSDKITLSLSPQTTILLTPLALDCLDAWILSSPELTRPERILEHLARATFASISNKIDSILQFTLNAPLLDVRLLQHSAVDLIRGTVPSPFFKGMKTLEAIANATNCVDAALQSLSINVDRRVSLSTSMAVELSLQTAELKVSSDYRHTTSVPEKHSCVLQLSTSAMSLQIFTSEDEKRARIRFGETAVECAQSAAETLASIVLCWVEPALGVIKNFAQLKRKALLRQQFLILAVLEQSGKYNISMLPLFLVRLSSLRARGQPTIQKNPDFQLVESLRCRMRNIASKPDFLEILTTLEDVDQLERRTESLLPDAKRFFEDSAEIDSRHQSHIPHSLFGVRFYSATTYLPTIIEEAPFWAGISECEITSEKTDIRLVDREETQNYLSCGRISVIGAAEARPYSTLVTGALTFRLDSVIVGIDPRLPRFVAHVADVREIFEGQYVDIVDRPGEKKQVVPNANSSNLQTIRLTVCGIMQTTVLRIDGLGIELDLSFRNLALSGDTELFLEETASEWILQQANGMLAFDKFVFVSFEKLQSNRRSVKYTPERPVLNTFEIAPSQISALVKTAGKIGIPVDIFAKIGKISIKAPRNVVRMADFVQSWMTNTLSEAQETIRGLKRDIAGARRTATTEFSPDIALPTIPTRYQTHFNAKFDGMGIAFQLSDHLQITYEMLEVAAHAKCQLPEVDDGSLKASLQIDSQVIRTAAAAGFDHAAREQQITLPKLRLTVNKTGLAYLARADVENIAFDLNMGFLDHLLKLQARAGEQLDGLLDLLKKIKRPLDEKQIASPKKLAGIKGELHFTLNSFCMGLKSPTVIQYVEAEQVSGTVAKSGGYEGYVDINNLALRLQPNVVNTKGQAGAPNKARNGTPPGKQNGYAFFRFDARIEVGRNTEGNGHLLDVTIKKVRAVMQAATTKGLTELVDHYKAEINLFQEERATEIEAMHKRLKSTIDQDLVKLQEPATELIATCRLKVSIGEIGIALPLDAAISTASNSLAPSKFPQAFLVSLQTLAFDGKRSESGSLLMDRLSAQFVSEFDQDRDEHYNPETARVHSSLALPNFQATVTYKKDAFDVHEYTVVATSQGLAIDLQATVVSMAFRLYKSLLSSSAEFNNLRQMAALQAEESGQPPPSALIRQTSRAHVKLDLTIHKGSLKLSSEKRPNHDRTRSANAIRQAIPSSRPRENTTKFETINLPSFKLNAHYRGAQDLTALKMSHRSSRERNELLVKVKVETSDNELRPSLIQFYSVAQRQFAVFVNTPTVSPQPAASPAAAFDPSSLTNESIQGLHLSMQLEIAASKLTVTSEKQVNVILDWKGGNFAISTSPDVKGANFVARTDQIILEVVHQLALDERKSITASASDLVVAASLRKLVVDNKEPSYVGSVVGNLGQVKVGVDMRCLQDWLSFYAVWFQGQHQPLDQSSSLSKPATRESDQHIVATTTSPPLATNTASGITLLFLGQIADFQVDLQLNSDEEAVSLSITKLAASARLVGGNTKSRQFRIMHQGISATLSGHNNVKSAVSMAHAYIVTELKNIGRELDVNNAQLVTIDMQFGPISASTERGVDRHLVLNLTSANVQVGDDWAHSLGQDQRILLNLQVQIGQLYIFATPNALPELIRQIGQVINCFTEAKKKSDDALNVSQSSLLSPKADLYSSVTQHLLDDSGTTERVDAAPTRTRTLVVATIFSIDRIFVDFFGGSLITSLSYNIDVSSLSVDLQRTQQPDGVLNRDMTLNFRDIYAYKLPELLKIGETSTEGISDLVARVLATRNTRGSTSLAEVPSMTATVLSKEVGDERVHTTNLFADNPRSAISSTLSWNEYQTARVVLKVYSNGVKAAFAKASEQNEAELAPKVTAIERKNGRKITLIAENTVDDIKLPNYSTAGESTQIILKFVPKVKNMVPSILNEEITDGLEEILGVIIRYYEVQLARHLAI